MQLHHLPWPYASTDYAISRVSLASQALDQLVAPQPAKAAVGSECWSHPDPPPTPTRSANVQHQTEAQAEEK